MHLKLLSICLVPFLFACSVSLKEQNKELVSNLEGNWDEVSENACADGFKTIKFSDNGKTLFITYSDVGYV